MTMLLRSYKTEINPTQEQICKINRTIGVSRFIYNFYLAKNKEIYEEEKRFMSGYDFSKCLIMTSSPTIRNINGLKK